MKNAAAARASLPKLVLGAVVLALVLAVCVSLTLGWVLQAPIGQHRAEVTVHMPRTGGLFEGSEVTYRGVAVGRVTGIDLAADGGVEVTVRLKPGAEVPRDSVAKVRSLSPVGEQYLDFRPGRDGGPHLADGDRVEASAEDLPVSIAKMVSGLEATLRQVDPDDVRTVLREVNTAFDGTGDDLRRLVDNTELLLQTVDETLPTIERVLVNGRTTLQVVTRSRVELVNLAAAAARVGTWYLAWDPDVRRMLERVPRDLARVQRLLDGSDRRLPGLLVEVNALSRMLALHGPALTATLQTVPYGIGRFASVMRNGWFNVTANVNGQRTCDYGVPRGNPTHVGRQGPNLVGRCGSGAPWRSAEHAPPALTH